MNILPSLLNNVKIASQLLSAPLFMVAVICFEEIRISIL